VPKAAQARYLSLTTALAVLALVAPAIGAPNHPDLSGIYDLTGGTVQGVGRVTINQTDSSIEIIRMFEGRENTNNIRLDGKLQPCFTPNWAPGTCRAQWAGQILMLHFYSREATGPRQPPIEVHTLERLSLQKNQQVLEIRIEIDAPLNPASSAPPPVPQTEIYTRE
jgi:hypothetical protein